jgi:hypothetical protein
MFIHETKHFTSRAQLRKVALYVSLQDLYVCLDRVSDAVWTANLGPRRAGICRALQQYTLCLLL